MNLQSTCKTRTQRSICLPLNDFNRLFGERLRKLHKVSKKNLETLKNFRFLTFLDQSEVLFCLEACINLHSKGALPNLINRLKKRFTSIHTKIVENWKKKIVFSTLFVSKASLFPSQICKSFYKKSTGCQIQLVLLYIFNILPFETFQKFQNVCMKLSKLILFYALSHLGPFEKF